ncbi:vesicular glutamate transporter 2.2-like [Aphidius gifuensis]|uniref:vesicular glutamate transporter 2.2-like n=1 Tax=Aphidius gifuensis TaxID=684658 RepID=UPI001CDCE0F0|nr:vesicular glutamate transporter 2.2-like [Aphidius gifuensis]
MITGFGAFLIKPITYVTKAEFGWDSTLQGFILSSFYYGYTPTQCLGGLLSARIGGKKVIGVGIGVSALLTLAIPTSARISVFLLIFLRIVIGLFEGVTYPSVNSIWANWAPPLERSKLGTLSFSGASSGTVVALPLSSLIAESLGWPAVFYIYGFFGLIWYAMWLYFISDKPDDDPWISPLELNFIKQSLNTDTRKTEGPISHPWKKILKSVPFWAIVAAHFSENWGHQTMMTQLPTFMQQVLHFGIVETGFLSALPYLGMTIIIIFSGHLADILRSKNYLTTTQVRKIFTCGAFIGQSIFIISSGYLNSSFQVIFCITSAISISGFAWSGFSINFLDIAPRHASVLFGISTTISMFTGIISPCITGFIVKDKSPASWRIVFIIAGIIYLVGAVIYSLFASGEKQKWADDENITDKTITDNKEVALN